jgi:hypothetical protein
MRLKSIELNTALAILIAFGATQGCGEDPESTGEPGGGNDLGESAPIGGSSAFPTGGATGGVTQNTGGASGGSTGGTKSVTGGAATGGSTGGTATSKGGSGGSSSTQGSGGGGKGGSATGGRLGFGGQGGRSSSSGGSGSAGKAAGGSGGGATVAFSSVATVIQNKCGGCHSTSARMPVLKNDANLRTTLTTYKVSRCGNNPMVTPMDTAKSALVGVVSKSCMGLSMPTPCNTTPCIPSADLTTIQNWIMGGALP